LNDTQKKAALASRDKLAADKVYAGKIVTQIAPAGDFYKAEDYHQHYFEKHPNDPRACHR
jgi:peptide methionine sulfoxide reductase MsrA